MLLENIRRNVGEHFFSILADETTDRAGREQLVVVLRYAAQQDDGSWCVREDPVRIVDLLAEIREKIDKSEDEVEAKLTGEKNRLRHP